jgi:hypothetical protein
MPAILEKPSVPSAANPPPSGIRATGGPKIKFSPEHREKIKRYIQARRAAAQADELKGEVLSIVGLYGGRVTAFDAMLSRGQSVSYSYPSAILRAEEKLRTEKKLAQLTGKASKQVKDCLQFADLAKE